MKFNKKGEKLYKVAGKVNDKFVKLTGIWLYLSEAWQKYLFEFFLHNIKRLPKNPNIF